MPKFVYEGDASQVSVGISGATFIRGQVNEVPDERLAAVLRNNPFFREVAQDELPEYPSPVSLMPRQGDPHPDPRVSAFMRGDTEEAQETGLTVGNLNREDQREANTASLAGREAQANEALETSTPPATEQKTPAAAKKTK